MEMIICLLFFALTCSVCIRLFSVSYTNRHKARNLNHMQEYLTTCAELLESWDGDIDAYASALSLAGAAPRVHVSPGNDLWTKAPATSYLGTVSLYFDKNWSSAAKETAAYTLDVSLYRFSREKTARVSFWQGAHDLVSEEAEGSPELLLYETTVRYPALEV